MVGVCDESTSSVGQKSGVKHCAHADLANRQGPAGMVHIRILMRPHDHRATCQRSAVDLRVVEISFGDITDVGRFDIARNPKRVAARSRYGNNFHILISRCHDRQAPNILKTFNPGARVP